MSLTKTLKQVRSEARVSELFPITHLNTPTIFESHSGLIGGVLRLTGIPFEIEEPASLNHHSFLLHQALVTLDSRFMVYITTHRHKSTCHLEGNFKPGFAKDLDEKYHARFKNKNAYTNHLYLTLVLKGDTSTKTGSCLTWAKKLYGKTHSELLEHIRESQVGVLNQALNQLEANLKSFGVTRLGKKDEELGFSELIQFLSLIINGGKALAFSMPHYNAPIAKDMAAVFKQENKYPRGHLGQYVSGHQLLFGEYIQFQGNATQDCTFGAMLSLKKYPTDTASLLLTPLLTLDTEFISTHSFAPIARDASLKLISDKRFKLKNAKDKALSQQDALSDLEDGIASEAALLGIHHHSLMLLAPSKKVLEGAIQEATKQYTAVGVVVVKETLGLEPAFWSQIPCNQHLITRASLITSLNFVDFCSLHNTQTGFHKNNFLKSAVTILESPSKTPIFFNYHSKGSATNPAKGHTAIFGGNNAGKTTLVNFLDAQMGRFGGRSFYLDRDESSKIYILASGNSAYLKISPSNPISMNPLKLPDTPENRSFLKIWLAALLMEEGENNIPSKLSELINEVIDYTFEQLSSDYRTLSHLSRFFPKDFPRWPQLKKWLKSDDTRIDGDFHWLFDNEEDALSLDFDKVGLDVTYLMDETKDHVARPVYLYLVHRMRQCLDGRLTSFVIDEAWQLFKSSFWVTCLEEWLPTIRKKNGHFIFMTQSAKTVTNSSIHHVVLDNLATMIVFPNPMADSETYQLHLKLTDAQLAAIKENNPESRIFLYKQDNEAMLCKLDLSDMGDYIRVLSGNVTSNKLLDTILKEKGHEVDSWLPVFLERSAL